MATVRSVITLDKDEADVLYKALHSDGVRAVLDEVRATLSAPLTVPPVDGQKRATSLTTRVRAGQEITEDTRKTLSEALEQRRKILHALVDLVGLVGDDATAIKHMVQAHDVAIDKLAVIATQIREHTAQQQ